MPKQLASVTIAWMIDTVSDRAAAPRTKLPSIFSLLKIVRLR